MTRKLVLLALAAAFASPAPAEVKSASAGHLDIENKAFVGAAPADAYAALTRIGQWWNPAHTYSGKAENLSLDARAGGCFCERLTDGGSVEHMRVVQAVPGSMLRMTGGLGPLQASAAAGTLTWSIRQVEGGAEITQTYVVGGFVPGGADKLAAPVDRVLGEQLNRLRSNLAR